MGRALRPVARYFARSILDRGGRNFEAGSGSKSRRCRLACGAAGGPRGSAASGGMSPQWLPEKTALPRRGGGRRFVDHPLHRTRAPGARWKAAACEGTPGPGGTPVSGALFLPMLGARANLAGRADASGRGQGRRGADGRRDGGSTLVRNMALARTLRPPI